MPAGDLVPRPMASHRRTPRHKDRVWGYDFITKQPERDGQMKLLTAVDKLARECLAIEVRRSFRGGDVMATLEELFVIRVETQYVVDR